MSGRLLWLSTLLLWFCGCVGVRDAGSLYFRQGDKIKGVEPADALMARMKKDQQLREITYGQTKSAKIVQCTLLRNQLYVAAMKNNQSKEIVDATKIIETAYQENDEKFIKACDQVLALPIGKTFIGIQQDYLIKKHN